MSSRVTVRDVALVDVVVVSFNSARTLGGCVAPLAGNDGLNVIVVDNASADRSIDTVSDLAVEIVALKTNRGFAFGCNRGFETGSAPYVLFLNPDARISSESIARLVEVLAAIGSVGLVAPRISSPDGALELSLRRFPRLLSTYSRAFFLHRAFPRVTWCNEDVWDWKEYARPHRVEWVSGACMLVRRSALEQLRGWDEEFFLYGEDIDLCRRLWSAGYEVWYEPAADAVHIGGASASRPLLRPVLVSSRIRYARKHRRPLSARLEQLGIALDELTHALFTRKGRGARVGHLRGLQTAFRGSQASRSPSRWSNSSTGDGGTLSE